MSELQKSYNEAEIIDVYLNTNKYIENIQNKFKITRLEINHIMMKNKIPLRISHHCKYCKVYNTIEKYGIKEFFSYLTTHNITNRSVERFFGMNTNLISRYFRYNYNVKLTDYGMVDYSRERQFDVNDWKLIKETSEKI